MTPKAGSPRVNLRVVPVQMSLLSPRIQTGPTDEFTSSTLTGHSTRAHRCRRMDSKSWSRRTAAHRITGATSMTWTQAEPCEGHKSVTQRWIGPLTCPSCKSTRGTASLVYTNAARHLASCFALKHACRSAALDIPLVCDAFSNDIVHKLHACPARKTDRCC